MRTAPGDGGDHRVGAVDRLADGVRVAAVALHHRGERRRVIEGLRAAGQGGHLVAAARSLGEHVHVSKLVRALERAGLVERAGNPSDTRAVQLSLTDRGVQVVTAGRAKVLQLEEQRLAPLGGAQSQPSVELRETLLTLLRHARNP